MSRVVTVPELLDGHTVLDIECLVSETTALLAARSPRLRRAPSDAKKAGHAYVVIDGTLIRSTGWLRTGRSTPASTGATA